MARRNRQHNIIPEQFFKLLGIQVLLALVTQINNLVTSLFASNSAGLGAATMGAIGLFDPIVYVLGALNIIFVTGATILSGKYMGRNELRQTQGVFSRDIRTITVLGLALAALFILGGNGVIARLLTRDEELQRQLGPYVTAYGIGVLPMMLNPHISCFLSLENRARRTTVASLVYIGVNILLNFLFLSAGLICNAFGLALASALGQWIFLAVQIQHYFTGQSTLKLTLRDCGRTGIWDLVAAGYASAIAMACQGLRGLIVNGLILDCPEVGSLGLSAFAASDSVMRMFWSVLAGMLAVFRMLTSICLGEEDRQSLVEVMRTVLWNCIPLQCVLAALIIAFAGPLAGLFYHPSDGAVYVMTVHALRIIPLCMPFSTFVAHFTFYAQASGKKLLVHLLSVLDGMACVAGFTALLMPVLRSMDSVYIANVLNGLVCTLVVVGFAWLANRRFPRTAGELMVIPEDFGVREADRMDITVRDMDQVVTISRQVMDFCQARGLTRRQAFFSGLFLEEMAGNIVAHGFNKDRRPHSIDIRVVHKGEDVILRIKDDCAPFDPHDRLALTDSEDRIRNLGIRVVFGCARDVSYQNTLGLNVLTLRV